MKRLLCLAALALFSASSALAADRPNFVFIYTDDQRSQAGAASSLHARRAFDISGGAAGAQQRAGDDGRAVGKQCLAKPVRLALLDQASALGHPDQRASSIEDLDQHKHQDHLHQPAVQGTDDIQLQESRRNAGRHR